MDNNPIVMCGRCYDQVPVFDEAKMFDPTTADGQKAMGTAMNNFAANMKQLQDHFKMSDDDFKQFRAVVIGSLVMEALGLKSV